MQIVILSGNPKQDGLCQTIIQAAHQGASCEGTLVSEIRLCDGNLIRCQVCDEGWGTCRDENVCIYGNDGFSQIQDHLRKADALILATPVYWGECSETLKCFLDRLRRCEFGTQGALSKKQALLIASAGGSGNGIVSCFNQLEQFCRHTDIQIFDRFGINRWNADYQLKAVYAAARSISEGRKTGDTVQPVPDENNRQ